MGKGYQLIVSVPGAAPAYYSLGARRIVIGRDPAHPISVNAKPVSALHCELTLGESGYTIADLGSRNGTRVNGEAIDSVPFPLASGDQILLGETVSAQIVEVGQVVDIAEPPAVDAGHDDEVDDDDYDEPLINPVAAAVASATRGLPQRVEG